MTRYTGVEEWIEELSQIRSQHDFTWYCPTCGVLHPGWNDKIVVCPYAEEDAEEELHESD